MGKGYKLHTKQLFFKAIRQNLTKSAVTTAIGNHLCKTTMRICNGNNVRNTSIGNHLHNGDDVSIVFKVNLHCRGCTHRIRNIILKFPGVRTVNFEGDDKVKVIGYGFVAVEALRRRIQEKTGKLVKLVKNNNNGAIKDCKSKEVSDCAKKQLPLTTVVLKVAWHCHCCAERIHKAVSSFKGVYEVEIDKDNHLLRVKGIMDTKKLVEELAKKLKRPVEIVPLPQKKHKGAGGNGGGRREDQVEEGGGSGGGEKGGKNGCTCQVHPYVAGSGYGNGFPDQVVYPFRFDAPQLFSDENSNRSGYGNGFPGYGNRLSGQVVDPFRMDTLELFSDENATGCSVM